MRPRLLLLLPLLLASLSACDGTRDVALPRHVFLITVDTLRADHLGFHGYRRNTSPNLDALAAKAVVFDRAIVQWPKTGPSFAAIWTGQYPHSTGLTHKAAIHVGDGYLTLPELFRDEGFTTLAVNSNGVLSTDLGWQQGFDEYLETRSHFPFGDDQRSYRDSMNARRVNELAFPLLAKHGKAARIFAWIHYSDPHAPYLLPTDFPNPFLGDAHFVGDEPVELEDPRATEIDGRRDLKYYVAQYDANIRIVDDAIAALLAKLKQLGLYEDSLLVFTADHGESLGEHGLYVEHGRLPYNETSHVPLFFLEPYRDAPGQRIARPVELIDLYPTLRELVAPKAPVAGLEGQSLRAFLRGEPESKADQAGAFLRAFSQAGGGSPLTHFRSVQESRWKLIYHPPLETKKGTLPERWELYDLSSDPGEKRDILTGNGPEVQRLRSLLEQWMNGRTWIYPPKGFAVQQSAEIEKQLRALGYLGN